MLIFIVLFYGYHIPSSAESLRVVSDAVSLYILFAKKSRKNRLSYMKCSILVRDKPSIDASVAKVFTYPFLPIVVASKYK